MRKSIIFLTVVGLIGLLSYCKKEGTQAVLLDNPTAPTVTVPGLTLLRAHGADTLIFTGTAIDPGFSASANYYLEADTVGNQFKNPVALANNIKGDVFKFSVSDLDAIFLKRFPSDTISSIEIRIRTVLVATGSNPLVYMSPTKTATLATYGPPALFLTTNGVKQSITSPADNGIYKGWIYTDGTAFVLTNKDNGKVYGGGAVLTEGGAAIALATGVYQITVDLTNPSNMTLVSKQVIIGIIGDAVGGWSNDTKMSYDFTDHSWNITVDVTAGGIKFRSTGNWDNWNVAYRPNAHDLNNLYQSHGSLNGAVLEPDLGDSQNIDNVAPGKYNVKLFIEKIPMRAVFTSASK